LAWCNGCGFTDYITYGLSILGISTIAALKNIRNLTVSNQQLSVVAEKQSTNVTVLRIATAAKNSVTQLYPKRPQMFLKQIEEIDKKIVRKLALHQIFDVNISICLQLESDRIINLSSIKDLMEYDFEIETLTDSISLRWSFVFDPEGKNDQHLHSVFLKITESPTAGILLQKMLSTRTDDLERPDSDMFSPISCKVDFADNRFSTELLALVTEWVEAQPRAETAFDFVNRIRDHGESITNFVSNTLPPLTVLAYVGVWLAYVPLSITASTKYSAAWILGGGAIFLVARYVAILINKFFGRHIRRISIVPLFQITAGDRNRMIKYMARSQRSVIVLAIGGLLYGFFKTVGVYLASLVITSSYLP
jgi:hypothetical protein